jgi:hypothetical protein
MKIFFALLAFLACTTASATSCAPGVACDLSKVPEGLLAMIIVTKDICSQKNPSQAEKYAEAFEKMVNEAPDAEVRDWIQKQLIRQNLSLK